MATEMDTRNIKPFINIAPGEFIKEQLELRDWTQQDLANILGVSLQAVSNVCTAKSAISPDMARRLGSAFGQTAQYWLNLEANYRLRLEDDSDTGVERKARVYERLPIAEVRKKKWLSADPKDASAIEGWLEHLWSTDIESALEQSLDLPMAARRSTAYEKYNACFAALWFQVARRMASVYEVDSYDSKAFRSIAEGIASYSKSFDGAAQYISDIGKAGVKFFTLSHLSKTYTDGAAFWDGDNPTIVWTGRIDWDDSFWFTVAHESAHVLLHLDDKGQYFVDAGVEDKEEREEEANEFARRSLAHEKMLAWFAPMRGQVSKKSVTDYARNNGVSPSLVVGCLHFNGLVQQNHMNSFRQHAKPLIPDEFKADSFVAEVIEEAS